MVAPLPEPLPVPPAGIKVVVHEGPLTPETGWKVFAIALKPYGTTTYPSAMSPKIKGLGPSAPAIPADPATRTSNFERRMSVVYDTRLWEYVGFDEVQDAQVVWVVRGAPVWATPSSVQ